MEEVRKFRKLTKMEKSIDVDTEEVSLCKNMQDSLQDEHIEIVDLSKIGSEHTFDELKVKRDPIAIIDSEVTRNVTLFK